MPDEVEGASEASTIAVGNVGTSQEGPPVAHVSPAADSDNDGEDADSCGDLRETNREDA